MPHTGHKRLEVLVHFVWSTNQRLPSITDGIEREVHRIIVQECQQLGCDVLAIGGMSDHIHVAVRLPSTVTLAQLVKQCKGVSSTLARALVAPEQGAFSWQNGYGAFSFSASQRSRVIGYINNQREHHTKGNLWYTVETFDASGPD